MNSNVVTNYYLQKYWIECSLKQMNPAKEFGLVCIFFPVSMKDVQKNLRG